MGSLAGAVRPAPPAAPAPERAPRRVLFVAATLGTGGAERFVSTACRLVPRDRLRPAVALLRPEIAYPVPEDVAVHSLDKPQGPGGIPVTLRRLARLIDAERPDVVVGAYAFANQILSEALLLARHRPRFVARIANSIDRVESSLKGGLSTRVARSWLLRAFARADVIVPNSHGLRGELLALRPRWADKAMVVHNPTDFAYLDAQAAAPDPLPRRRALRLVAISRLSPVKRLDVLLQAMAALPPATDWDLVLCGHGPERASLEDLARRLGIADRVIFHGFTDNPHAILAGADLFVQTSASEGLPNALIEAQGLGVPAVSSDCCHGPREIVEHGATGLLVPVGDVAATTEAVAALLADEGRRRAMGAEARSLARQRFSSDTLMARLTEVLETPA